MENYPLSWVYPGGEIIGHSMGSMVRIGTQAEPAISFVEAAIPRPTLLSLPLVYSRPELSYLLTAHRGNGVMFLHAPYIDVYLLEVKH